MGQPSFPASQSATSWPSVGPPLTVGDRDVDFVLFCGMVCRTICTVVCTLCCALAAPARASDDGIKVWTEPVAGSDTPTAVVEATIDARPAVLWPLISRCAEYKNRMPRIASSRELSRTGDENAAFTTTCEVTADLPFPLSDLTSLSRADHVVQPDVRYVRSWKMISGDYDLNEGSWTLVAIDGGARTRVTYRLRARPRVPLPDAVLRQVQSGTLPDMMRNLRVQAAKLSARLPPPSGP
jgi:ribosome-associated toxin RatA of RatAB toxin-antitoxin module